jgi:hypothetical protein
MGMLERRWTLILGGTLVFGILVLPGPAALGRETEEQLLQRIQAEQNPVKKAKDEIKLARLKLTQVQNAYSQGHFEEGAKHLSALVEAMKSSWKLLQDSGRKASKHSEGFRELDISLRESVRALEDLGRTVSYYDRAPLVDAAQQLDRMRDEVLHALFPEEKTRNRKSSPAPQPAPNPENPTGVR